MLDKFAIAFPTSTANGYLFVMSIGERVAITGSPDRAMKFSTEQAAKDGLVAARLTKSLKPAILRSVIILSCS